MIPLGTSVNIIDDKYLSAKSGRTTTIVFPAYSSCSANLTAAAAAAPQDIPTNRPSSLANLKPSQLIRHLLLVQPCQQLISQGS